MHPLLKSCRRDQNNLRSKWETFVCMLNEGRSTNIMYPLVSSVFLTLAANKKKLNGFMSKSPQLKM